MSLTLLAIENPLGVVGFKAHKGVLSTEKEAAKEQMKKFKKMEKGDDLGKFAKQHPTNRYANRAEAIKNFIDGDEIALDIVKDTVNNRDYVNKLIIKAKSKFPSLRVALCSSLNSALKYLTAYTQSNPNIFFDTVIVFGHGLPGSMNLGLGYATMPPRITNRLDENYQTHKKVRDVFGLDQRPNKPGLKVRELGSYNVTDWTSLFSAHQDSFVVANTGHFHLFLMGCSVGLVDETNTNNVVKESAEALYTALDEVPVCIAAPTGPVDHRHLEDLMERLSGIRQNLIEGDLVSLEGSLEKGKDTVGLRCVCKKHDDG
jgi:hypothetical protein